MKEISGQTFHYNHTVKEWSDGPALNQARKDHAAGIVTDEETNEKLFIVTGGIGTNGILKSTEILLLGTWSNGN